MKLSRYFLVGLASLGWQLGLVSAADPSLPAAVAPAETFPLPVVGQAVAQPGRPIELGCDNACGGCDRRGGVIAGAGMYIIQPYFSNNMAFGVNGTSGRAVDANGVTTTP